MTKPQSPDAAPAEWPDERKAQRRLIDDDEEGAQMLRRRGVQRRAHDLGDSGYRVVAIEKVVTARDLASVGALRVPGAARLTVGWTPHAAECPTCEQCRKPAPGHACDVKHCPWMPSVEPAPAALAGDDRTVSELLKDSGKQEFEKDPALAERIAYLADKMRGISVVTWCEFLAELNAALVKSRQPAPTRETIYGALIEVASRHESASSRCCTHMTDAILALWEGR